ncbi:hypothetical protein ACSJLP_27620 [Gordonia rhizosphera NBRC 16068]|uniref:Uncharacterized protein n=1 Tax=Gordonia rhizosphera NBRC 16068 TaxID=1108045 RepID=K6UXQ1_9ACTN|nr:hypothetical protein GORHZ_006_00420 [Gordonia rhizosphera NBRC 16068]
MDEKAAVVLNDAFVSTEARSYQYHMSGYSGERSEVVVRAGELGRANGSGIPPVPISGRLAARLQETSGSLTIGGLPMVGGAPNNFTIRVFRSYSPVEVESVVISGQPETKWYPPSAVDVSIVFESEQEDCRSGVLSSRKQLDGAVPETVGPSQLSWLSTSRVSPTWTITDLSDKRGESNILFVSGLMLGAAFAFAGAAIERALQGYD